MPADPTPDVRRRAVPLPALAIVLLALLVVGCGKGRSNPLASFESRCADLPPTRYEVAQVPLTWTEDRTQSYDELTVRGGNTPATHTTFGLTTVRFGHQTHIELRLIEDAAGKRVCGTAAVKVELSMQPVAVYVARQLEPTPCASDATFSHEMKHVSVFREVLDDARRDLAADLADALGTELRRAATRTELERTFNAQVEAYLSVFMKQWQRQMKARQDAVDSEDEYRRVATACPP